MSWLKSIGAKAAKVGNVLKKSYGPLDALDPTKSVAETYRYPLDVGNMNLYPHTIEFLCWKPEPVDWGQLMGPELDSRIKKASDWASEQINVDPIIAGDAQKAAGGAILRGDPNSYLYKRAQSGIRVNNNQQYNGERITDFTRRAELTDIIAMYLPSQTLQETFQNDYSELSLTQALGGIGWALDAGGSIVEAVKNLTGDGSASGGISDLRPMIVQAITAGIGGAAADVGDVFLQAGGYATNPQLEILYKGTKFRTFDFKFDLMPRSKKEADEVLTIVKKFKYHAAPEYRQAQGRFIVPPSFFDININFGAVENERIPLKLSTCVLTGIDIDYSSGTEQMVSFSDGGPIQMSMQLRFTELEIMHKKLREEGY